MRARVTLTVRACFAILHQINLMRHSLTRPALLCALVISKLDYCNSVLAGAPAVLLGRFQSVLNAAARLVFSANRSAHISHMTPLLQELQWLRVPERIQFRLCADVPLSQRHRATVLERMYPSCI